jgi:hypothetical protein
MTKTKRNAPQSTVNTRTLSSAELVATAGGYYRVPPGSRHDFRQNDDNYSH